MLSNLFLWSAKSNVRAIARSVGLVLVAVILILPGGTVMTQPDQPDAYYDFLRWNCRIKGNRARVSVHNRITINHKRGEEQAHLVFYENKFVRLKKVEITVEDSRGQVIGSYDKNDLSRDCGFGAGYQVFSDICTYYLAPTSAGYPYAIEYHLKQELKSLFFLSGPRVAYDIPVNSMESRLECPADLKVHYKVYGLDINPEETVSDGDRVLIFSGNDIPAIDTDTLSRLDGSRAGEICMVANKFDFAGREFSGWNWSGIGAWYADVARDRYEHRLSGPSSSALSQPDALETMKQVYNSVSNKTRYVSVSVGVSGWRPRKVEETRKTRYGDCKDMSTMLVSDLAQHGIEAFPVLVLTRDEGYVDPDFPSFEFNHVIAVALHSNDTVWMDPTCQWCPFGELPWTDEATSALLVTDTGGVLVNTPRAPSEKNHTIREVRIEMLPSGKLVAVGSITATGGRARYLRGYLPHMTRQEIREWMGRVVSSGNTRFAVKDAEIINCNDRDAPLRVTFKALSTTPVPLVNGVRFFDPILFNVGLGYDQTDVEGRIRPINISYPRTVTDRVVIITDSAQVVDSVRLPDEFQTEYRFGSRSLTAWRGADSCGIEMIHSYEVYEVIPEEFDDLMAFEAALKTRADHYVRIFSR